MESSSTKDTITISWNPVDNSYCGSVMYYTGLVDSDLMRTETLSQTLTGLDCGTEYNISIMTGNRAGNAEPEIITVKTSKYIDQ